MLGSNQQHHTQWLSEEESADMMAPSSPPKKKSMERLSRLFQKKSKHKKSLTEEDTPLPEPPMYSSSVSRHSSLHSTQSSIPSRFNSTSKKGGGDTLKRLASLRPSNKSVSELQQELEQKQRVLEQLHEEKRHHTQDSHRLAQELQRLQQRTQDRIDSTQQLQTHYDTHLSSLRATPDDLQSVRIKIIHIQQAITDLADRLVPHASPDTTCHALASFWLNLRHVIEPMCPLTPTYIRHLTEKFIMDVLVQNFNLSEIAGCACSDDYAQLALWFLDHDTDDTTTKDNDDDNTNNINNNDLSDAMVFSIRLRQQVAFTVVAAQQHKDTIKQDLQQVVQNHWKYLYGGLAKAYPYIYHHDTSLETEVDKHFGAQIQGLVEQAVALGFAIKGLEVDITAADVQEGTQRLDLALMDDLLGNRSGIIQFCISPPFRIFNQAEPLVKGKVLCSPLP